MPLPRDPSAPRKKYALARFIREWNASHPEAQRITYYREPGEETSGFNPDSEVIGTAARETLKKVQRAVKAPHIDGQFDRETMRLLLPEKDRGIRREVMALAHSQLGVHEWPPGSNRGEVLKYLKAAGVPFGAPWCASFVTWTLENCGVRAQPGNPAWVPAWHEYARQKKLLIPIDDSKLGDLWIWWRDQHIGFCDDTKPDDLIALGLDGNVGNYGGSVTHVKRTSGEVTAAISLVKLAAVKAAVKAA